MRTRSALPAIFLIATCWMPAVSLGQGIVLPASGAINRAMGGATTGAAIDAIGSLYINPATISGLDSCELAFGFEGIYNTYIVESSIFGVGSGSTASEAGVMPVPSIGWVHQTCNPNVRFGLGLFGQAGYATNVPTDPTNPIVSPPPAQGGFGVGRIQAQAIFFEVAPALSVAVTDRLSIGLGPTLSMATIPIDEIPFVAPNANGTYPRGNGTRYHFGGGAQLGFYYVHNCCWQFGGNIKTPTWMENFRYHTEDASGLPRVAKVDLDLPAIASLGAAYTGIPDVTLTADVRYTDYNNTQGFGDPAEFQPDGSVGGLGWRSVFSVHLGARLRLTPRLYAMLGYMYVDDLIDDKSAFFNLGSDLSYRHVPSIGGSFLLSNCVAVSLAYEYLPQWDSTGPFYFPGAGALPGTSVTNRIDAHIGTFGVNVKY